jgi:hypothetical protein
MFNHTINYSENCGFFITSHCFDDEIVVAGKKEKGARFAGSLARFEDVMQVLFYVEGLSEITRGYIV